MELSDWLAFQHFIRRRLEKKLGLSSEEEDDLLL
jgi:hypothetical protein